MSGGAGVEEKSRSCSRSAPRAARGSGRARPHQAGAALGGAPRRRARGDRRRRRAQGHRRLRACVPASRRDSRCARREALARLGIDAGVHGHIGDGNYHVALMVDPADPGRRFRPLEGVRRDPDRRRAARAASGSADAYLAEEHGDLLPLMRGMKSLLDPKRDLEAREGAAGLSEVEPSCMRSFPAVSRSFMSAVLICSLAVGTAGCTRWASTPRRPRRPRRRPRRSTARCSRAPARLPGVGPFPEVRGAAPQWLRVHRRLEPAEPAPGSRWRSRSRRAPTVPRAAAWSRTNARIGKGVVALAGPRFGRINVLWTAEPEGADRNAVYGCVRDSS